MSFLWPLALLSLLIVPVVLGWYVWNGRRTSRAPESSLGLGYSTTRPIGWKRHIAPALTMLALASLLVGFARPQATVAVPELRSTVVLAFDTSQSMIADDVEPTRLDAAKEAAKDFVLAQPESVEVGIVSFGSAGAITLRPTNDRGTVVSSIDRLQAAGGTSLSEGLFSALSAIAKDPIIYIPDEQGNVDIPAVDFGGFGSAIIVVLSDGEDTSELDPAPLADLAATAGIRIYPVGLGSTEGSVIEADGFSIATALNEASLVDLAERSNGEYFQAEDSADLVQITNTIKRDLELVDEEREITSLFAIGSLALLAVAGLWSMRLHGRMP